MIVHVFNTSVVSGPEKLVLPALARRPRRFAVVNLLESRLAKPGAPDALAEYCKSLGLRYEAVPVRGRWDGAAMKKLGAVLAELKPELVHAHVGKASVYAARARKALPGVPFFSTHHGVRGLPDLKTRLYELVYRRLFLRRFDRVLCVSTEDFQAVRRAGPGADKVRLHLNGADGRFVPPEKRAAERARARAAWPDEARGDAFLLGVVGRLSREKDHERLLRVLAALERAGAPRDWRLLVFGAGDLEAALKRRGAELGLEGRVLWLGYRPDAAAELPGLDLLVSFSKAEGLPVNLVEAGWSGTPVLATLVGGVKDLLPDPFHGTGVPPREAPEETAQRLAALMSEDGRLALESQGRRFQERVRREFSRDRWLARLAELYEESGVRLAP